MTAYKPGDTVLFTSSGSKDGFPKEHAVSGRVGVVTRVLDETEVDIDEVGNMYVVSFPAVEVQAFEDELERAAPDALDNGYNEHYRIIPSAEAEALARAAAEAEVGVFETAGVIVNGDVTLTEVGGFKVGDKVRIVWDGVRPSPYVGDFPDRVHTIKGFFAIDDEPPICASLDGGGSGSSCEIRGLVHAKPLRKRVKA